MYAHSSDVNIWKTYGNTTVVFPKGWHLTVLPIRNNFFFFAWVGIWVYIRRRSQDCVKKYTSIFLVTLQMKSSHITHIKDDKLRAIQWYTYLWNWAINKGRRWMFAWSWAHNRFFISNFQPNPIYLEAKHFIRDIFLAKRINILNYSNIRGRWKNGRLS